MKNTNLIGKFLLTLFVLGVPLSAYPQASVIASRRYGEKNPLQYTFSSFEQLGNTCYNDPEPVGTTVSLLCLQPASVLLDSNTFASTSDFTTVLNQGAGGSFSVSGNVGIFTSSTTSGNKIWVSSNASMLPFSSQIVSSEITVNGTNSAVQMGYSDSTGANAFYCQFIPSIGIPRIGVVNAGVTTTWVGSTVSAMTAPWYMACALTNTHVAIWIGSSPSTMTEIQFQDVGSTLNPTTITYANYKAFVGLQSQSLTSNTFRFANFMSGGFGGVGLHSLTPVIYSDGRPYVQGSKVWLYSPISGTTYVGTGIASWDACGIFTYDFVSQDLVLKSLMGAQNATGVTNYCGGNIVYEPSTNTERLMAQNTESINIQYSSQSISVDDWLGSAKYHIAPTVQAMTGLTTNQAFHPYLTCTQWNYSTLVCGRWETAWADVDPGGTIAYPAAAYSTSDPSLNSWTRIFIDATRGDHEGSFTLRTATGSTGRAYYDQWIKEASLLVTTIGDSINFGDVYLNSGTYQGRISAPWPGTGLVPPNPFLISYGNKEYAITTGGYWTRFGIYPFWGRPVISQTNKYSTQTIWPILAAGITSGSTSTAGNLSITTGDWVVAYCSGSQSSTPLSATITSSLSMGDFTSDVFDVFGTNFFQQLSHVKATAGGTTSITCTPNASSTNLKITVLIIHPGFTSSTDYVGASDPSSGLNYTSLPFSTSDKGAVVVCARNSNTSGSQYYPPGSIGSYMALPAFGTQSALCQMAVTESAQTNVTAKIGYSRTTGGSWGGAIISFK